MKKTEYDMLKETTQPALLVARASALFNRKPRTLVYGFTCDHDTFHVYLDADGIHKVVYDGTTKALKAHKHETETLNLGECVPDKRIYPDACDFEFCALLKRHGVFLSFASFRETVNPADFQGLRLEQLVQPALSA